MKRKYMSLLLTIVKTMKYSTEQKTENTVRGEHSTGRAQHGENTARGEHSAGRTARGEHRAESTVQRGYDAL